MSGFFFSLLLLFTRLLFSISQLVRKSVANPEQKKKKKEASKKKRREVGKKTNWQNDQKIKIPTRCAEKYFCLFVRL